MGSSAAMKGELPMGYKYILSRQREEEMEVEKPPRCKKNISLIPAFSQRIRRCQELQFNVKRMVAESGVQGVVSSGVGSDLEGKKTDDYHIRKLFKKSVIVKYRLYLPLEMKTGHRC